MELSHFQNVTENAGLWSQEDPIYLREMVYLNLQEASFEISTVLVQTVLAFGKAGMLFALCLFHKLHAVKHKAGVDMCSVEDTPKTLPLSKLSPLPHWLSSEPRCVAISVS